MNKSEYLLTLLAEESLEISHRCTKSLRFGLMEIQGGQIYTNAHRIEREINDLRAVLNLLHKEQPLFRITPDIDQIQKHEEQILAYMNYSRGLGTLR